MQVDFFCRDYYFINMQYLTSQDLRKLAPATQKMPQSEENLVSTKAFLRRVEKMGFHPIFAAQGTAHADADAPLKSRHFVVASNKDDFAVALLNSHSIWRRAWIGVGFATGPAFMVGAAVPLPRWRGFEEPLETALAYKDTLVVTKKALSDWTLEDHQARWLAKQFAASAWLKGHKRPLTKSLLASGAGNSAYALLHVFLDSARKGGLSPEPVDSFKPPRKLKPILSPDALMHAASQTFQVGLRGLAKYKLGNFAFPAYTNSR